MWIVKLTGTDASGEEYEQGIRIPGDGALRLLENPEYRWEMVELLLARGAVKKVEIDFIPGDGPRRIYESPDGFYYPKIGDRLVRQAYRRRGDAWAAMVPKW